MTSAKVGLYDDVISIVRVIISEIPNICEKFDVNRHRGSEDILA